MAVKRWLIGWFLAGSAVLAAQAASAAGPYQFFPIPPCRLADTRNLPGPNAGPALAAGMPRSFQVDNLCGVPLTAQAAALNVTMVGPTQDGFLIVWPYNTPQPSTSNINAAGGTGAIANGCLVSLAGGTINVSVVYGAGAGATTNVILDVTGYYQ